MEATGRVQGKAGVIWTVHGIRSKQTTWLKTLAAKLRDRGKPAELFYYGFTFALSAWLVSRFAAKELARRAGLGDWIIVHSNGARVVYWARKKYGMPACNVILISGALDRDVKWPEGMDDRVYNFHTPNDKVLKWARRIPFSPWGSIGREGYQGDDDRFENIEFDHITGHNDWANDLDNLADMINGMIDESQAY